MQRLKNIIEFLPIWVSRQCDKNVLMIASKHFRTNKNHTSIYHNILIAKCECVLRCGFKVHFTFKKNVFATRGMMALSKSQAKQHMVKNAINPA